MQVEENNDLETQDRISTFREFLEADFLQSQYKDKIKKLVEKGKDRRLIVNLNHLRSYRPDLAKGLLDAPMDYLPAFEIAVTEVANAIRPSDNSYYIGLEGSFGDNMISPRNLNSSHLGKTICIEAIVSRCSLVRPKVARSVHYCEATHVFSAREYRDGLSLSNDMPTGSTYPRTDENGNPLSIEFGFSTYRDFQMVYIQEMPERSPAGQMPRPIDVMCDDDLVDRCKPGDRVVITGTYRSRGKSGASMSAVFSTIFLANNITLLNKDISNPTLTEHDAREIRKIGKRADVFNLISQSLAPSLYGHPEIKQSLLLLMLGGVEKNLENGTHLRGDINILLIGDPSVGKSQMLRFVLNLAPLAIATTGRGSSGVGLTAAVTQDKETEAGAMVLADRGVVCIDEFDKMSDIDRVAIHEVMEQQTVTIAKAGIHTSLNARCSVLAAANPAFGSYVDEKKPYENITMPDSLLSRFDLVFVVLDKTDDEFNRHISEHITRLHRYTPPGVAEGVPMTETMVTSLKSAQALQDEPSADTPVFEKFNELLHIGIKKPGRRRNNNNVEILSIPFLKKYLYYAKNRVNPVLTPEAADFISTKYSELRAKIEGAQDKFRTMPITPRTLETLIRLATAHAKCRLSKLVEQEDAEAAYDILVFALFKEVKPRKREKKQKINKDDSDSENDAETIVSRTTVTRASVGTSRISQAAASANMGLVDDIVNGAGSISISQGASTGVGSRLVSAAGSVQASQEVPVNVQPTIEEEIAEMSVERESLNKIRVFYTEERGDSPNVTLPEIHEKINDGVDSLAFTEPEVIRQLQFMSNENMSLWFQEENDSVLFF